MADSFKLTVTTPSNLFYTGKVEQIIVNTPVGHEGFMAHHLWTCKLLDAGELWIKEEGSAEDEWKIASAAGGFIDIKDSVVIYTDIVEWDKGPEKRKVRIINTK